MDQFREKRIGDVGDDQPEQLAAAGDQCASLRIRNVPTSLMALRTLAAMSGLTARTPLTERDMVAAETPVRFATSRIPN